MNTLFPGRPNYTGPTTGWFALLHHDCLFEYSHHVAERVEYVRSCKPKNEIAVRLRNMLYLGDCPVMGERAALDADHDARRDVLIADYHAKRALLNADYGAKGKPLDAGYCAKRVALDAGYCAKRVALDAAYAAKHSALSADYDAKRAPLDAALNVEVLAYLKAWLPDCPWNGKTLVFNTEA